MTVIAWDGKTLAADKRMSFGTSFSTTTKIHRIGDMLAACSGDASMGRQLLDWVRAGMVAADYPDNKDGDANKFLAGLLVIKADGSINYFTISPLGMVLEDRYFTLGSGGEYAAAMLHMGWDARKAVEVACELDSGCGNGIDTLELA